ncbi:MULTISPECIES: coniferyl aldehyde dehydrogenase [Vibrio]|jgi:coniferyl-aldehyde dehydrogenase|uniref:coniferyl aldehyde dehydrogenase n=1 Tax=Vibrio TaxID=662 RepID=UPI000BFF9678|nr:coniferyl aldehyde dehydrogenase [Vibrio sp. PID17_43]PHJ41886.1 aldehyde dehydrogenase [Vibrio sp. PID17_43]
MSDNFAHLSRTFEQQVSAYKAFKTSSAQERRDIIQQVIQLLVDHYQPLIEAMEADFGGRSQTFSMMNDILGSLGSLKHTRDNLEQWLKPEQRSMIAPYEQLGAQAEVLYQPKGVIGIMGTWNAPLYTLLSPLACAVGAGNRVILKPSELTPRTAEVLAELLQTNIDPNWVSVITGDSEVSKAFCATPFDHIVFTGSPSVGKKVMAAAAENLTPVTLELGGKSPAIISSSANLKEASQKLAIAKGTNGGQICISPDIVYVPSDALDTVVAEIKAEFKRCYPTVINNPDLVPIINASHYERIHHYIEQALSQGVQIELSHDERDATGRRMPLTLVINPPSDILIMNEEIFGLALVIKTYENFNDVLTDINSRPNPLALYYFGEDQQEQKQVLEDVRAGGVTINDALMHAALHDAPFGGTGESGMGHYHGKEGFLAFSHLKTVFYAPNNDIRREWGMLPPYSTDFHTLIKSQITSE